MNRRLFISVAGALVAAPASLFAADEAAPEEGKKKKRKRNGMKDDKNEAAAEFVPLFNGKDLTGWAGVDAQEGTWKVEDGKLVVEKGHGGWLRTEREYRNFVLKLEFNLTPGGNSGVFLRAPLAGNSAYEGLEIQVLDHFHEMYHKPGAEIRDVQYTGSIYDLVPSADPKAIKPAGEWNSYVITHRGDKIKVELNGVLVADANLADYQKDIAKHPGVGRKEGYIGLQSHDSRVEFRNIMLRELK